MAVYLIRNYGGYTASSTVPVTFPDSTEASLIAQGLATAAQTTSWASTVGGPDGFVTQGGNTNDANQAGYTTPTNPAGSVDLAEHRARLAGAHELRDQRRDADRGPVELRRDHRPVLQHLERCWRAERDHRGHEQVHRRAVGHERHAARELGGCGRAERWRLGDAELQLPEPDQPGAGPLLPRPADGRGDGHRAARPLGQRVERDVRHAVRDLRHRAEHHDRSDHVHHGGRADHAALTV
jgi:hypothetical protein